MDIHYVPEPLQVVRYLKLRKDRDPPKNRRKTHKRIVLKHLLGLNMKKVNHQLSEPQKGLSTLKLLSIPRENNRNLKAHRRKTLLNQEGDQD